MEKEAITGNVHQKLFSKELEGIGGVPICKTCKYRTWNYRCKKQRDIITGKPYSCEVSRALKDDFICGTEGKFYEEKPEKNHFLLSPGIITLMHVALVISTLSLGTLAVSIVAGVLILENAGLLLFVDHILKGED